MEYAAGGGRYEGKRFQLCALHRAGGEEVRAELDDPPLRYCRVPGTDAPGFLPHPSRQGQCAAAGFQRREADGQFPGNHAGMDESGAGLGELRLARGVLLLSGSRQCRQREAVSWASGQFRHRRFRPAESRSAGCRRPLSAGCGTAGEFPGGIHDARNFDAGSARRDVSGRVS